MVRLNINCKKCNNDLIIFLTLPVITCSEYTYYCYNGCTNGEITIIIPEYIPHEQEDIYIMEKIKLEC